MKKKNGTRECPAARGAYRALSFAVFGGGACTAVTAALITLYAILVQKVRLFGI